LECAGTTKKMSELFLQILLVASAAVAVKLAAAASVKRGMSPLYLLLPLGVVLGPTVFNLFGSPLFPGDGGGGGFGWRENVSTSAGLMKVLIELGLIQLVFAAGALTGFESLKKHSASFILSGLMIFLIPAAFSILVLKIFGASWTLALATASIVSVGSAALAAKARSNEDEQAAIAQGATLTAFVLGAGLLIIASGLRFEPTYGAGMTALGIFYFFLKAFLLVGSAFVVGRIYLKRAASRARFARSIQGVVGFILLFALFYGWAAWSVGQIAALPVAFVFGGLFARSDFEIKEKAINGLSKPDSWLISLFFLAFGLSVDFFELQTQIGIFLLLLTVAVAGKILGARLGAKITERATGEGLKLAARTFPIGEAGLILAFFAYSRGTIVPEVFTVAAAIILLTTFAAPFFSPFEKSPVKKQETPDSPKRTKKRGRAILSRKAVQ
jgi:Kef-type K+ transport system membrane component KefB